MYRTLRLARPALTKRITSTQPRKALRAFSASSSRLSDHGGAPQLYGPGTKDPLAIPTDEEQSTGIERYQLLGKMEGIDVFDMKPLESGRLGTLADPIKVHSFYPERVIGCTGFPADSHDTIWLSLNTQKEHHRCPECGSVYNLDFQGSHDAHHH